jgi:hypothetical protein
MVMGHGNAGCRGGLLSDSQFPGVLVGPPRVRKCGSSGTYGREKGCWSEYVGWSSCGGLSDLLLLVVSEGREELTTDEGNDLLLNSVRGAGGVVVSKDEVAAGRKGSGEAWGSQLKVFSLSSVLHLV